MIKFIPESEWAIGLLILKRFEQLKLKKFKNKFKFKLKLSQISYLLTPSP